MSGPSHIISMITSIYPTNESVVITSRAFSNSERQGQIATLTAPSESSSATLGIQNYQHFIHQKKYY